MQFKHVLLKLKLNGTKATYHRPRCNLCGKPRVSYVHNKLMDCRYSSLYKKCQKIKLGRRLGDF